MPLGDIRLLFVRARLLNMENQIFLSILRFRDSFDPSFGSGTRLLWHSGGNALIIGNPSMNHDNAQCACCCGRSTVIIVCSGNFGRYTVRFHDVDESQ